MWGPRNNDVIDQKRQLLLTNRATHLCKRNDMAGLKKLASPHCYHAEFGRSALKNIEEPPKLGSSGIPLAVKPSARSANMANSAIHPSGVSKLVIHVIRYVDYGGEDLALLTGA